MSEASSTALKRGTNYSHDGMIDLIIACPGISQNEIAMLLGYTPSWVSTIMASDAFAAALAKRRAEIIDPRIVATIRERFAGIALRAAEVIGEKLDKPANAISDQLALRSLELASRAAGYGVRDVPVTTPTTQVDVNIYLETMGEALTNLLRRKRALVDAEHAEIPEAEDTAPASLPANDRPA